MPMHICPFCKFSCCIEGGHRVCIDKAAAQAKKAEEDCIRDRTIEACASVVESIHLRRHTHPQAEAYALGWERGIQAAARALRAQLPDSN